MEASIIFGNNLHTPVVKVLQSMGNSKPAKVDYQDELHTGEQKCDGDYRYKVIRNAVELKHKSIEIITYIIFMTCQSIV